MDELERMAATAEAEIESYLPPSIEPVVLFGERYPLLTATLAIGATALLMLLLRPAPRTMR